MLICHETGKIICIICIILNCIFLQILSFYMNFIKSCYHPSHVASSYKIQKSLVLKNSFRHFAAKEGFFKSIKVVEHLLQCARAQIASARNSSCCSCYQSKSSTSYWRCISALLFCSNNLSSLRAPSWIEIASYKIYRPIVNVTIDNYCCLNHQNKNNFLVSNLLDKLRFPVLLSVLNRWEKRAGNFNLSKKLLIRQLFLFWFASNIVHRSLTT